MKKQVMIAMLLLTMLVITSCSVTVPCPAYKNGKSLKHQGVYNPVRYAGKYHYSTSDYYVRGK